MWGAVTCCLGELRRISDGEPLLIRIVIKKGGGRATRISEGGADTARLGTVPIGEAVLFLLSTHATDPS